MTTRGYKRTRRRTTRRILEEKTTKNLQGAKQAVNVEMQNLLKKKTVQLKPHLLRTTLTVLRKMSWRENVKTTARNHSQKICGG